MASTEEKLPVNAQDFSEKGHVVLRLNQIQRNILQDPALFDKLDTDRSLNHLRKEVQSLQAALLKTLRQEAEYEYQQLLLAEALLISWATESELGDILLLDSHRFKELDQAYQDCEGYAHWLLVIDNLREERKRLLSKYQGYFEGQQTDLDNQRQDTQKKLKPCKPQMEEWRLKMEALNQVQQQINYLSQQSMNGLVGGLGAIVAGIVIFEVLNIWGGWFLGFVVGCIAFANLAGHYSYLEGPAMKDLYAFLIERYEVKNIKPFFRYTNEKTPLEPTQYDATRGEALAKFMQKDVVEARNNYGNLERQHLEHLNYLQYLESRKAWVEEQIDKLQQIANAQYGITPPPAKKEVQTVDPALSSELASHVKSAGSATGPLPDLPAEQSSVPSVEFEAIPETIEVPPAPSSAVRKQPARNRKTRPAKLSSSSAKQISSDQI